MRTNRNELLGSASRRMRRARRTTGRLVVAALGFGLAYYLDPQNGAERRARLGAACRRMTRRVDAALVAEAGEPAPTPPGFRTPRPGREASWNSAAGAPPEPEHGVAPQVDGAVPTSRGA